MHTLTCENTVQNDGLCAGMSVSHTNLMASVRHVDDEMLGGVLETSSLHGLGH